MHDFNPLYFLEGGGAVVKAIRDVDWAKTPIGPIETWPVALKTTVSTILNSHFPAAIVWGPDYTTIYNDAFRPILGNKPEAMGRPFYEIWQEAWDEIGSIADRAYAGEATFIEDFPLEINRFGRTEKAYFTFCYSPLRDDQGRLAGLLDTVVETTGKVEIQQQSRVLNAELQHRIKNTLAMVTSIVNQTLRRLPNAGPVKEALMLRLTALANTHDALTGTGRASAAIGDIVSGALSPHEASQKQMTVEGPRIRLSERQALSLALAINELATNSIKYGSLSTSVGDVRIAWSVTDGDDGKFQFSWEEKNGPIVEPPTRKGFGSLLIERVVPGDFGGTATLSYDPSGLYYTMVTDRNQIVDRLEH
ncbi:PAS domain-containing protein [Rhizobium sp. XQZ8]|uniref:sensor histidine kinase n=1 Tax=Rhizobium populisoli TaxID=2859785 RepID=UPI001CA4A65E|nr:PAS domain-containing sensor histidine kinase [Rhizobium populisoli]MBW6423897.1 PAS domain-containing protein [Rhizobium populisoli]